MAVHQPSFAALLDNMSTAVLVFDSKLLLQFMNSAAENLLNTSLHRCHIQPANHIFIEDQHRAEVLAKANARKQLFTKRRTQLFLPTRSEPSETASKQSHGGELWPEALARWADSTLKTGKSDLLTQSLPEFERIMITSALKHRHGKKRDAAELLG